MIIAPTSSFTEALLALPLLRSLDAYYPDFSHWYLTTVMPGVVLGKDVLLLARSTDGAIAGIALGKKSESETKLRCIRVLPQHQQSGLGIKLIDRMIVELECEKPHCTVAEEMLHLYSRAFVNRYGFALSAVEKGAFRQGKLEYGFN